MGSVDGTVVEKIMYFKSLRLVILKALRAQRDIGAPLSN